MKTRATSASRIRATADPQPMIVSCATIAMTLRPLAWCGFHSPVTFCILASVIASPSSSSEIQAGGCDGEGTCADYLATLSNTPPQECQDDSWHAFAFPHPTLGATVYSVRLIYEGLGDAGDVYLMSDGGGCPDTEAVLWHGCCGMPSGDAGYRDETICTGPIATEDTTWVVVVPRSSLSFSMVFDLYPQGPGHGYLNLLGDGDCLNWWDLEGFISPYGETYGGCYCVYLSTDPCEQQVINCGDAEPPTCQPLPDCDGDINRDGVVDPLDVGYVLARFTADVCDAGACQADANCDGVIDPLDAGYALARFGQCLAPTACEVACP